MVISYYSINDLSFLTKKSSKNVWKKQAITKKYGVYFKIYLRN
jgi:hypothetical protein